ncbi:MAG: antibiotic biosynthesis monooxygenase [Gammaproteobacteria bacterium]|jgi:quinol monooxygenase YgiN|nr:antibiotic biosynthesis monooxygenase [Gammaproteobacteria bacterium]MDP7455540.1 antibiotic biosynthesis monooxygenase [Gammaproteobacteria bacterium]HJP04106.1 antibiotic biosynthesis monooxygenase [Gammaproteobacteria bacterium]
MQTFGLNYEVKPEHVEDFKSVMMHLIDTVKSREGHIETRVYSDVERPTSMMIYSNWKTKVEFADFVRSDIFKKMMADAVAMLESRPTHLLGESIRLIKPAE